MSESRGAELLLDVARQLPRVAEQEPGHQAALRRRQVTAAGEDPGAQRVGRAVQLRAGGLEGEQLDGVEAGHCVPPSQPLVVAGEWLEPSRQFDFVARFEQTQLAGGVAGGGGEHDAAAGRAAVDARHPDEHARVVLLAVGVLDERRRDRRGSARVPGRSERRVRLPVERSLHERRCQQCDCDDGQRETRRAPREDQRPHRSEQAEHEEGDGGPGAELLAEPGADDDRRHQRDRARGMAAPQIVTRSFKSAKRFSPMPRTSRSSLTDRKPPRRSRSVMIASASVGPIPGSSSSSAGVALLRFTSADGSALPPSLPPGDADPAGAASPTRCTSTRWPWAILAARLSRFRSASGAPPPAASTASMTRAAGSRSYTPGVATAPATCTVTRSPFSPALGASPVAAELLDPALVAGARRVVGDASDSPAPSRYQMNPAASATTSRAAIPTRGSPRNSRTRSTKRSKGPPHSLGRGGDAGGCSGCSGAPQNSELGMATSGRARIETGGSETGSAHAARPLCVRPLP